MPETNVGAISDAHNSIAFGKPQDTNLEEIETSEMKDFQFKSATFTGNFTLGRRVGSQKTLSDAGTSNADNPVILSTDLFAPYNVDQANKAVLVKKIGSGGTGTVFLVFVITSLQI